MQYRNVVNVIEKEVSYVVLCTHQRSLQNLLVSVDHHRWLTKLLRYGFEIQYRLRSGKQKNCCWWLKLVIVLNDLLGGTTIVSCDILPHLN